jgi:glucose/mannose-6-phosphate isomerase
MAAQPLDRQALAAVDSTGQTGDILDLASHLRDALWRLESTDLAPAPEPGGLVVAGMGGSGIGGRLAAAALGRRATRPIVLAQDYGLPPWVGPGWTVLCSSYSGATEETLAAFEAAGAAGARRIVATTGGPLAQAARDAGVPVVPLPGGFQPRAAVGYALVVALEAAALAGAGPSLRPEIEVAADLVEQLAAEWGPDGPDNGEAKALARDLHGHVIVVAGAELTAPLAYRWKCQLNENAKLPAFSAELPESDHNEIVGWAGADGLGPFAAVYLEDIEHNPRNRLRIEVTAQLAAQGAAVVRRVEPRGEGPLERMASLILLGDLVSLYLAVLRGRDPVDIEPIDLLKAALAER